MLISTQRFGDLNLADNELFLFPAGLIGMERMRQWALIPDSENEALAYLQSTSRAEISLPVISPRAFFAEYRVRVSQRDLSALKMRPGAPTYILTTISDNAGRITANLRAPIVLNTDARIGVQLITTDAQPVQESLPDATARRLAA